MNNITKNLLLWVVVLMVLMSVFGSMVEPPANKTDVPYSDFIKMVQNGQIEEVVIDPETSVHRKITAVTSSGEQLTVQAGDDPHLEDDLILNDVKYSIKAPQQDG